MNDPFTVIFPMAGKGERFGGTFKPFLEVSEGTTFIEEAFKPFRGLENLSRVVFVYLREQEEQYNIHSQLKLLFGDVSFEVCVLDCETNGPAETISNALESISLTGPVFVADCDTSVDIQPILLFLSENNVDCALPLWRLETEEIHKWSVASVVEGGRVTGITEKQIPDSPGEFFGVIGCYFFKDARVLCGSYCKNISEIIANLIREGSSVFGLKVSTAAFFGDPERLEEFQNKYDSRPPTIFCDIDGTIITHEDTPLMSGIQLLDGALEKLLSWKKRGGQIILVTARSKVNERYLKKELDRHKVPYDKLIAGVTSGPRIVINDRKPSMSLNESALSFEVERDVGIKDIFYNPFTIKVISKMKGGSFADTFLIQEGARKKIRKTVQKTLDLEHGYVKLKKQYSNLLRFKSLAPDLIPDIYEEKENSFEYYFDIEYLEGYQMLVTATEKTKKEALSSLLCSLDKKVYQYQASLHSGLNWIENHLSQKVYPVLKKTGFDSSVVILEEVRKKYGSELMPTAICPVHGDLTLQNILFKKEKEQTSIKLIDMDGASYMDARELDLGKVFQSLLAQYEKWDALPSAELRNCDVDLDLNKVNPYVNIWEGILGEDRARVLLKIQFYTALHLFRMLPFRLKKCPEQMRFAHQLGLQLIQNLIK